VVYTQHNVSKSDRSWNTSSTDLLRCRSEQRTARKPKQPLDTKSPIQVFAIGAEVLPGCLDRRRLGGPGRSPGRKRRLSPVVALLACSSLPSRMAFGSVTRPRPERCQCPPSRIPSFDGRCYAGSREFLIGRPLTGRDWGRKTRSSAGFLPIADFAPADRVRRLVLISRGLRFHASAASFSPAAGPSNRSSDHPGVFASCPIVSTPISARRAFATGPA
jgi:hypothetical protein